MASSTFNIHQSAQKEQPDFDAEYYKRQYQNAAKALELYEGEREAQEQERIRKSLLELAALRKRRARSRNLTPFAHSSILPLPIYKD